LLARALTVWLDCDDDVLLERIGEVDRPLLGQEPEVALARLRRERAAWYEEVSKVRVDASSTLEEVARAVIDETKALTS